MSTEEAKHIADLQGISTGELAKRFHELYGENNRTRDRAYLIDKITQYITSYGVKWYCGICKLNLSIWEIEDGRWTVLSHAMRAICQSSELTPAEIYYILVTCNAEKRFQHYWESSDFYRKAGMGEHVANFINNKDFGSKALAGDNAWSLGNVEEAISYYQQSVDHGEEQGSGGLVRIYFVLDRFEDCIAAFRDACPPHEYYVEYKELTGDGDKDYDWEDYEKLSARFPDKSSAFISDALYMCRIIIAGSLRSGGPDDDLRTKISDYFNITIEQIHELSRSLEENDAAVIHLKNRIAPKPVDSGQTLAQLYTIGETHRARQIADLANQCDALISKCTDSIHRYLKSGSDADLEQIIYDGSPFGINSLDVLIIEEALEQSEIEIAQAPNQRIALIRRLNAICSYPKYDFLGDYLEVMNQIDEEIEVGDVISAILGLQWYKTPYTLDDTGPFSASRGLGKTEISKNRDWLEIVLQDYPTIFDRKHFKTRDSAIAALYHAYQFLKDRYNEVRDQERWVSEAQLGDALKTLFGKSVVQRHVRPIWLAPQHLDYFLPNYNLAIEYMGVQHYEAIEMFGGAKGLQETKIRDEKKRTLCERMGVSLVYVTYEEDIGRRAQEIYNIYHPGENRP